MLTRPSDGGLWRSLLWRDSGEPVTTAGGLCHFDRWKLPCHFDRAKRVEKSVTTKRLGLSGLRKASAAKRE